VLELLAAAGQRGITEAALSALGCRVETLSNVVRTGLASATRTGRRPAKVGQRLTSACWCKPCIRATFMVGQTMPDEAANALSMRERMVWSAWPAGRICIGPATSRGGTARPRSVSVSTPSPSREIRLL
jgi:hypothetical protein